MPDPNDWADLVSPGTDLSGAVPTDEYEHCPRCGEVEYRWQIFADQPSVTPDEISGPIFTKCLCGNLYRSDAVHKVRADQPVGSARVCVASERQSPAPSEVMPPGCNDMQDISNEIGRRPEFDPALYVPIASQQLATYPWAIWAERRRRAVAAFYAANGATQVILPPNEEAGP